MAEDRKVTATTMSSRSLKQPRCIDRSEIKDKKFIHKMMDILGCSKIDAVCSPIPGFGKKLEDIPCLVRAKRCNEEQLKEKDLLLHCEHLNRLSEGDDDISCTQSSILESDSGLFDMVCKKCQIDKPYKIFKENKFSLQSTKQTLGSEKNGSLSSMPLGETQSWNRTVLESVDLDGVKDFNLNLRHMFCHHPHGRQTSIRKGDGVVLDSLPCISAVKNDIKDDECTRAFSRVDEPNIKSEKRGTFQSLWNMENNTGKTQLQNKESENLLLKDDNNVSYVQLKVEENENPMVTVKSHFKRSDVNLKENDCCFQSPIKNLISEHNEAALFMPFCRPLLGSRYIDRLCDVLPTRILKENLRETDHCSQLVEHISSWEGDNSILSSPSCSHKFDDNLEDNEIMSYFAGINDINGTHRVKDSIQIPKEISNVRNWHTEKSTEITLQESKQQSECLNLQNCQKSVALHITDKKNEIADMKSHVKTDEATDLRTEIKDGFCELSNKLVCYVPGSRHQLEDADSRSDKKYPRHGGNCKRRKHPKRPKKSPRRDNSVRMMYCNDKEKSLRYKTQGFENEKESIEKAKRNYFTALVAARTEPGEESLALVARLRSQLESRLAIPLFPSFLSPPCGHYAVGT